MKKVLVSVLATFIFSLIYGQDLTKEEAPPLKDRIFFGGNFALQLGTYTDIEVAPIVGIWLRPRIALAGGVTYMYSKDPYYGKQSIYGGRAYAEYVVFQDLDKFIPLGIHTSLMLHLEDELLRWKDTSLTENINANSVLGGPGISQQIGRRASINLMVLWTLVDSGYQIYSNPELKIGFTF
jgi:hypothetical protein